MQRQAVALPSDEPRSSAMGVGESNNYNFGQTKPFLAPVGEAAVGTDYCLLTTDYSLLLFLFFPKQKVKRKRK